LAKENKLLDEREGKLPPLAQGGSLHDEIKKAVERWNKIDYKRLNFKRMTDLYAKENTQIENFKNLLKARGKEIEEREERKMQKKDKETENLEKRMQKIISRYEELAKENELLDEREGKLPSPLQGENIHDKIENAVKSWNDIDYKLLNFREMTSLYAKENPQIDNFKSLLRARKTKIEEEEKKLKTAQNKQQLPNDKKEEDEIKIDTPERQEITDLTQEQPEKIKKEEEDLHHRTNLTSDDSPHLQDNVNKDESENDDGEIPDLKEGKKNTTIDAQKPQKSNVLYVVLISTLLIGVACVKFIEVINKKNKEKNSGKESEKQEKNK